MFIHVYPLFIHVDLASCLSIALFILCWKILEGICQDCHGFLAQHIYDSRFKVRCPKHGWFQIQTMTDDPSGQNLITTSRCDLTGTMVMVSRGNYPILSPNDLISGIFRLVNLVNYYNLPRLHIHFSCLDVGCPNIGSLNIAVSHRRCWLGVSSSFRQYHIYFMLEHFVRLCLTPISDAKSTSFGA